MSTDWERLVERMREMLDVGSALTLLSWDQHVTMPPAGAESRARALATLEGISHAKLADPELGALLQSLEADDSLDDDQRISVRLLARDHTKATLVPPDLVRALAEAEATALNVWTEARPASDWKPFEPHLERLVKLKKEHADALGWSENRYDAMLDLYEPEAKAAEIEALFGELAARLRPLVDAIVDAAGEPPDFLSLTYDAETQKAFSDWLIEQLGFDTSGGRLDTSPHPVTFHVAHGDVRQTTRADPTAFLSSVYATIHETGHALYDQGVPAEFADLPIGQLNSVALHESQSRLWENHVGRSRQFTAFMLPHLKDRWPSELGTVEPDEFYRGANHPRRTLIRVHADEVTYNLHVILRFELELAIFRDQLEVADLPGAWDDAMERHLGVRPADVSEGVMQDMHWAIGYMGYFPTYTLGTLHAAAFFAKTTEDLEGLHDDLARGEVGRLLEWLRDNVHRQGARKPSKELAEEVLGRSLSVDPFIEHIRAKYGELYDVALPEA